MNEKRPKTYRMVLRASVDSTDEPNQEDLAAKLALAEAEAEALRRELALRRQEKIQDLSKMTPGMDADGKLTKKIDGAGFRETLLRGPRTADASSSPGSGWGLSEAQLFLSKNSAPTEGGIGNLQGAAMEEGAQETVQRRLIIGLGLAAAAGVASMVSLPTTLVRPSKPLFFYVAPLVALQARLEVLAATGDALDSTTLKLQLKSAVGPKGELRTNLLSAAALLEGSASSQASTTALEVLDYLEQADYSNYFDNVGTPSPAQQGEFLKFSLQAIKVAKSKLTDFLLRIPSEVVEAALLQISSQNALQA